MSRRYVCEGCGGIFESGDDWGDEEAVAEFKRMYPNMEFDMSKLAIVCDDCHKKIDEIRRKMN